MEYEWGEIVYLLQDSVIQLFLRRNLNVQTRNPQLRSNAT
jgi:hypothetical protein